jgi:hypothetical protein
VLPLRLLLAGVAAMAQGASQQHSSTAGLMSAAQGTRRQAYWRPCKHTYRYSSFEGFTHCPCDALQVDVAIIGGGLCGLACAAALHKVYPDCKIKVRSEQIMLYIPPSYSSRSSQHSNHFQMLDGSLALLSAQLHCMLQAECRIALSSQHQHVCNITLW